MCELGGESTVRSITWRFPAGEQIGIGLEPLAGVLGSQAILGRANPEKVRPHGLAVGQLGQHVGSLDDILLLAKLFC